MNSCEDGWTARHENFDKANNSVLFQVPTLAYMRNTIVMARHKGAEQPILLQVDKNSHKPKQNMQKTSHDAERKLQYWYQTLARYGLTEAVPTKKNSQGDNPNQLKAFS